MERGRLGVVTLPWTSTAPCIALKAANCCIKLQ
jgi:hypothetical protein